MEQNFTDAVTMKNNSFHLNQILQELLKRGTIDNC